MPHTLQIPNFMQVMSKRYKEPCKVPEIGGKERKQIPYEERMKHLSAFIIANLLVNAPAFSSANRVSSSFVGSYSLIESEKGDCATTLIIKEVEAPNYALWTTFRDENEAFLGNEKYTDINAPRQSETDSCMTAGPVIPFCIETRKELTRYNEEKQVLENFYGKKSNYSKSARYRYSKVERIGDDIKVTQLEMEKVLAPGVFTMTAIEIGATNRPFNPFVEVSKDSVCTYIRD